MFHGRLSEHDEGCPLELDGDLGVARGQPLAGAQVEGHIGPAPVVDHQLERGVRLGGGVAGHVRFRAIPRDLLAIRHHPVAILSPHRQVEHLIGLDRLDRAQDLALLVAHRVRLEGDRRLHGDERQQLEEVVRHHVAQRARLLVVAAARPDTHLLGHGDLHVVHVAAIPDGLEDGVGEAEDQDVLDRLLTQVVVDPVDL